MRSFDGCSRTLSAVADDTTEFREGVRNRRVGQKGLNRGTGQAGFLKRHMAGGAAINNVLLRQPNLLESTLEMLLQLCRIGARPHQTQVLALVNAPGTVLLFDCANRQRDQEQQADRTKGAGTVAEE
jgi:hypothetical protein